MPEHNLAESRSHMGAWAIVSAPLVLGFDLRDDAKLGAAWPIIANRDVLHISQVHRQTAPFERLPEDSVMTRRALRLAELGERRIAPVGTPGLALAGAQPADVHSARRVRRDCVCRRQPQVCRVGRRRPVRAQSRLHAQPLPQELRDV